MRLPSYLNFNTMYSITLDFIETKNLFTTNMTDIVNLS